MSLEKISGVEALIRWWTLLNFMEKTQCGCLFQCGTLLIFAKYIGDSNSGRITVPGLLTLITAVEKFHPRPLYFGYSLYINMKYFQCIHLIRDVFFEKNRSGTIFAPILTHPIYSGLKKIL